MASSAFVPFIADTIRITRVDACGTPIVGERSTLVTTGIISVALESDVDNGTDIEVKNARQELVARVPANPITKDVKVTLTLTGVNVDLYEICTAQQLVTDGSGNSIGLSVKESVPFTSGFALETWSQMTFEGSDSCVEGGQEWGYFLTPFMSNGLIGNMELNSGALSCVITGVSRRSSGWGVGPYNVANAATVAGQVTPAPLATTWEPTEILRMFRTPVAPPEPTDGAIALATA